MYCLVVSGDEEAWNKPNGHHDFDYSRTAHEYTVNALREQFKDKLDGLTELPCIFSNEYGTKQPAQFGWITKVERRQQTVRIHYEIQKDFPTVTMEQLKELEWQLDIGNLEMYRTHLAVKEVDLLAVLVEAKVINPEQAKTGKAGKVPPQEAPPTLHISPQVFRIPDTAPDPKLVSVMMPFGAPFNPVYKTLQAACEEVGLKCERVDNIWEEDAIIDDIFSLLYRSTYVICDFSGRNSNVFYEAGIAHTLGRSVIPIVQNGDHIPFDLRHRRYQAYENTKDGLPALQQVLVKRLKTLQEKAKK